MGVDPSDRLVPGKTVILYVIENRSVPWCFIDQFSSLASVGR